MADENRLMFGTHEVHMIKIYEQYLGGDRIHFTCLGAPSPHPTADADEPGRYPPHFTIEVQRGKGLEWVGKMFGITKGDPRLAIIDF